MVFVPEKCWEYCVPKVEILDGIISGNFKVFDDYLLFEDTGILSIFIVKQYQLVSCT